MPDTTRAAGFEAATEGREADRAALATANPAIPPHPDSWLAGYQQGQQARLEAAKDTTTLEAPVPSGTGASPVAPRLFHGSKYRLHAGQVLVGGAMPAHNAADPGSFVYFSPRVSVATHFGSHADAPPDEPNAERRVYVVRPLADVEADPFEDASARSYRARRVQVVEEIDPYNEPWE